MFNAAIFNKSKYADPSAARRRQRYRALRSGIPPVDSRQRILRRDCWWMKCLLLAWRIAECHDHEESKKKRTRSPIQVRDISSHVMVRTQSHDHMTQSVPFGSKKSLWLNMKKNLNKSLRKTRRERCSLVTNCVCLWETGLCMLQLEPLSFLN